MLKAWDRYNLSFWALYSQSHRSPHMQAQAMPACESPDDPTQQLVTYPHITQVRSEPTRSTLHTLTMAEFKVTPCKPNWFNLNIKGVAKWLAMWANNTQEPNPCSASPRTTSQAGCLVTKHPGTRREEPQTTWPLHPSSNLHVCPDTPHREGKRDRSVTSFCYLEKCWIRLTSNQGEEGC